MNGTTTPKNQPATDADHPNVKFTTFPTAKVTAGKRVDTAWRDLCATLTAPTEHATKQNMPLWRPTISAGDSRAAGTAVDQVFAVVGDYDGGLVTPADAAERLRNAGVTALVHTTASHSSDRPRWRVVAPLAAPITPEALPRYVSMLNGALGGALGGVLAPESWECTRIYFYGRVRGVPFEHYTADGLTLDVVALCASFDPIGKPANQVQRKSSMPHKGHADAGDRDLDRAFALDQVNADTMADLQSALAPISPDDRSMWVEIGIAMSSLKGSKFEEQAREMWVEWSQRSTNWRDGDDAQWETFAATDATYRKVFAVAAENGWQNPRKEDYNALIDYTDLGNVNLLAKLMKGNLRYVPALKVWLRWGVGRWEADATAAVAFDAARLVAKHYKREVAAAAAKLAQTHDADTAKALRKYIETVEAWARRCRARQSLENMVALAAKDSRFVLDGDQLDRNPHLLGVQNGVVDLRTGELRPDAREDYVTMRCAAPYRRDAPAVRWGQFIEEVTGYPVAVGRDADDAALPETVGRYVARRPYALYLQKALGYSISAVTDEQKMFITYGQHGANGKNLLFDTLRVHVLGAYAGTARPELLMTSRRSDMDANRATPALMALRRLRLVTLSEPLAGAELDNPTVKAMTGDRTISGRANYATTEGSVDVTFHLWMLANVKPQFKHKEEAVLGRMLLLPFDRQWNRPGTAMHNPEVPDADAGLQHALAGEAEGILAWLVRGAVAYFREGLSPCHEVRDTTALYFQEQDPVGRWLGEFERCEPSVGTPGRKLFGMFTAWRVAQEAAGALSDGAAPTAETAFGLKLTALRVPSKKGHGPKLYGVRMPRDADFDDDLQAKIAAAGLDDLC